MDFRTTPYEVRTVVAKVGNRSFTLAAEVRDPATETVYARAGTVVVGQEPLTTSARAKLAALEDPRLVESRSR
jgi:acyl-CoA thioester hydrolase